MDRKVIIGMCVSAVLFACCTGKPKKAAVEEQEDLKAKEMFQGIWLSDDTEIPLMRVDGDTVYYTATHSPIGIVRHYTSASCFKIQANRRSAR